MSLRKKITLLFVIPSGIITGLFCFLLTDSALRQFKQDFSEGIRASAEHIKNGLVALMLKGEGKDFQRYLESGPVGDIKSIRLLRDDGFIIGSSNPVEVNTFYPKEKIHILTDVNNTFSGFMEKPSRIAGSESIYIPLYNEMPCQRCHPDEKKIRAILGIEISTVRYFEEVSRIKTKAFFYFIILLTFFAGLIWILFGIAFERPIRNILKTIEDVRRGDLKTRVITGRSDALGEISRGLNDLISDLEKTKRDFELCHLAEMRRVEQMATLGELASAIAHEIRNPLAAISGAVQVFAEEFPPSDPRQSIIREILNEVERLDRSVRDLLIYAKTPEPSLKYVSAKFIFERLERFIEPQAKKSNVTVALHIPEGEDLYVDPELIHQAFFHIAQFSIQNMLEGGTLTIELKTEEKFHVISFSDTGAGIPPDEIKFLFKPFYARTTSLSTLGLTISRGILEKHGGKIEVKSVVGRGTTFSVYLPRKLT